MTRKHYAMIAQGFANALRFCESEAQVNAWLFGVVEVAKQLEADNPRFDRNRFMQACGCVMG